MHHHHTCDLLLKPQPVLSFLPRSMYPPPLAKYLMTKTYIQPKISKQPSWQLDWKLPGFWTLSNISNQRHHNAFTFKPLGAFRLPLRPCLLIGHPTAASLHHSISVMVPLSTPGLRPEHLYPGQSQYPPCAANSIHLVRSRLGSFLQYTPHTLFRLFRRMFLCKGGVC